MQTIWRVIIVQHVLIWTLQEHWIDVDNADGRQLICDANTIRLIDEAALQLIPRLKFIPIVPRLGYKRTGVFALPFSVDFAVFVCGRRHAKHNGGRCRLQLSKERVHRCVEELAHAFAHQFELRPRLAVDWQRTLATRCFANWCRCAAVLIKVSAGVEHEHLSLIHI